MPPVVISKGKVSLADHLKLNELPLATTPAGKNFVLKSLHPSEHTVKSARVPGGNFPSVCVVSDMITTINITNAGGVVQIAQTANPAIPVVMTINDGGTTDAYNFMAAGLGGTVSKNTPYYTVRNFFDGIRARFERYRVTSQSVTAELIAPTLSNQGTITAAQYINEPHTASLVSLASATSAELFPDFWSYEALKPASTWLLGTSAYTAKAIDGVYQPLKLSSFKWRSTNDPAIYIENPNAVLPFTATLNQPIFFPYYSNRASGVISTLDYGFKPSSSSVGVIEMAGLAANVAVRVRVRQIIEVTGLPSSFYAPMFEAPLPPDEIACKMYYEISARMADAYPASYNDLGKLKDIIYKIGKKILPFAEPVLDVVSAIPGPVGLIGSAAKGIVPVASAALEKAKAKRKKKKAAAAVAADALSQKRKMVTAPAGQSKQFPY